MAMLLAGCGAPHAYVTLHATNAPPERLSEWGVVQVRAKHLVLGQGVVPYDLATPLFSDYAHKLRTVWMPPGASATYRERGVFEFPVGTVVSKTFFYPRITGVENAVLAVDDGPSLDALSSSLSDLRLVETRLLVRQSEGWQALAYVWNEDQTEAFLEIAGDLKRFEMRTSDGLSRRLHYLVPTRNECAACHVTDHSDGALVPIGLAARHLDKGYADDSTPQLDRWGRMGYLEGRPAAPMTPANATWDPGARDDLEHRARSYLDINCAHCHNPRGAADTSGLFLDIEQRSLRRLGWCKPPVAAGRGSGGRRASIVPGAPDASILLFRMESTDPAVMMPELGRTLPHTEGVALVRDWIASLRGHCELSAGELL